MQLTLHKQKPRRKPTLRLRFKKTSNGGFQLGLGIVIATRKKKIGGARLATPMVEPIFLHVKQIQPLLMRGKIFIFRLPNQLCRRKILREQRRGKKKGAYDEAP